MKKFLAILLAVVLCIGTCSFAAVATDEGFVVTAQGGTAQRGGTISVPIVVEKNVGWRNLGIRVNYDADVLEISCPNHEDGKNCIGKRTPEIAKKEDFEVAEDYGCSNVGQLGQYHTANPYPLDWAYATIEEDITETGAYATFTFKVKADAAFGTTKVDIEIVNIDNCAGSGASIVTLANDATITIACDGHVPATNWSTDGTNHWKDCTKCGADMQLGAHTGGTATCKDKAVCSVCNTAYGELNADKHVNTEIREDEPASCNTPGYTGDTWCLDCNTQIGTGTVINPTGDHVDADNDWESNGDQHFHTCSCGTEFDKENHKGGTATCKDKAVCSVCNTAYGNLNPDKHVNTEIRDALTESCNTPGYTGDTWCKDCETKVGNGSVINPTGAHVDADGDWESDGTQHFHTCGCGTPFDKENHKGGTATCKDKAVCTVCNTAYGNLNPDKHVNTEIRDAEPVSCNTPGYTGDTWCKDCETKVGNGSVINPTGDHVDADNDWESNGTQHFHTCGCGTEFDKENHKGGTATCKDKAVCSVCNTAYGTVNASNHTGGTEVKDAVEAKCNQEGYTGDTYCKGCGEKIATGSKIAKPAHVVTTWTVTEPATTEKKGLKSGECSGCHATITVETAKLVADIKDENVVGNGVEIEILGDSNISDDAVFSANDVTNTVADSEKEKIEDAIKANDKLNGTVIGGIFDLGFILREKDVNGDTVADSDYDFDGTAKVTLPISKSLLNSLDNMKLVCIDANGVAVEVAYTIEDGKAVFEASEFGYYAFVGTEKAASGAEGDKSPQTGETNHIAIVFVVLSLVASAVVVFGRKKSRA